MRKLYHLLLNIGGIVGGVSLIALALMVTIDVTVRWITGSPIAGVFELSGPALLLAIFGPLGLMQHQQRQIRMDIVSASARGRWADALVLLDALAGLVAFALLIWMTTTELQKSYYGGFRSSGAIEIPRTIPLIVVLAGSALLMASLVRQAFRAIRPPAGHSGEDMPRLPSRPVDGGAA